MNKKNFVPEGAMEKAIVKKQNGLIIRLAIDSDAEVRDDECGLTRPDILASEEFFSLPIRTAAAVIACGMSDRLREEAMSFMKLRHPDSEVIGLMEDMESVPNQAPLPEEEKLMQAVLDGSVRKICRAIKEDAVVFRSMTKERCAVLCRGLLNLKPHTVVLLLARGIHYASVSALLKFLVRECEHEDALKDMGYRQRLMIANLLIHILQGEITPEDRELIGQDWYPMGNSIENGCDRRIYSHSYSYYFDPMHIYEPRNTDGEYERPEHIIR